MVRPFIEQAIESWLQGFSVIPLRPHIAKPYEGFNCEPFKTRQPTLAEMLEWSKQYPGAGLGIVVRYKADPAKTRETIRAMDLDNIMDIPVYILLKCKKAVGG